MPMRWFVPPTVMPFPSIASFTSRRLLRMASGALPWTRTSKSTESCAGS